MMFTLEQARKYKGLTQEELAQKMGFSKQNYFEYEKYRRIFDMKRAFRFAEITGIPVDQIIFFEGQVQKFCSEEVTK